MAHEILYALKLAESGVKVQMGGWKPDHLQKGMQELAAKVESLPAYLEDLAKQTVALGVGWGGDTVVWKPDIKGNASVTTIQHKVLTSPEEESFGRELINAAQQLAGDRQEKALPGGPRVASMRVASLMLTNDAHPLQSKPAGELAAKIKAELSHGYGAAALHTFVDRVEVTTTTTFFAFKVEAGAVTLESEAKSEAIKELKGLTPPTTKEKPAKQEASAGSTAAMDEQKAYEAAVQARGKWVREQPDPEKAAIDKIVSGVAGKEKPEERRVAMKEAIATAREKSEDDALYLEAVLFARCGWVLYGDDESKARKAPEFQAKMKDMSVRLKSGRTTSTPAARRVSRPSGRRRTPSGRRSSRRATSWRTRARSSPNGGRRVRTRSSGTSCTTFATRGWTRSRSSSGISRRSTPTPPSPSRRSGSSSTTPRRSASRCSRAS
jgi:hypothetical protein